MNNIRPVVTLPTTTVPTYVQKVVGTKSLLSSDIEEFRGIPYGIIPGRWQHSLLRQSLPQDVYYANSNGPKCPQPGEMNSSDYYQSHLDFPTDVIDSEFDCLNLFIIRPSPEAVTRAGCKIGGTGLPVLVWIHGGGYGFGASTDPIWDPTRLVVRSILLGTPIIAVCLNYRLSIFGFAASSDLLNAQSASQFRGCNFGVRDQKVALTWISQNIASFGGDSRNITLGGQSAGALSVHLHTLEAKFKRARPPFRRAIIQSGAVGCLGPISLDTANTHWEELCQQVGLHNKDVVTRMEHLRRMTAEDLLRASRSLNWITFPLVVDNLSVAETSLDCEIAVAFGDVDELPLATEDAEDDSIAVLIGDTDAEVCGLRNLPFQLSFPEIFVLKLMVSSGIAQGEIFSRQIRKIQRVEEIQSIFYDVYPSTSSADRVLQAYGLASDIPLPELHHRLIQFSNDVVFGYSIYRANTFLATYQPKSPSSDNPADKWSRHLALAQAIRHTNVQSYRVKFGNPFPGPNHDVAHHCVELIYLFDAFHDALLSVDHVSYSSEVSNDEQLEASRFPNSAADSGYASAADSPSAKQYLRGSLAGTSARHSNSDLVFTIQKQWIKFIVGEADSRVEDTVQNSIEAIMVYGKDRAVSVESRLHGPEFVEERKRYEILGLHPMEMKLAHSRITGSVLT